MSLWAQRSLTPAGLIPRDSDLSSIAILCPLLMLMTFAKRPERVIGPGTLAPWGCCVCLRLPETEAVEDFPQRPPRGKSGSLGRALRAPTGQTSARVNPSFSGYQP